MNAPEKTFPNSKVEIHKRISAGKNTVSDCQPIVTIANTPAG